MDFVSRQSRPVKRRLSARTPDHPPEASTAPAVPARQVVLSAAALWLCYFALITVRGLLADMGDFNELLWRRALVTLIGIGVTILTWPLLRRFEARSLAIKATAALLIMFPAALLIAFTNQLVFAPVEHRIIATIAQEREASRAATGREPDIRIRQDMAGNVLVDVPDEPPPPPSARPGVPVPPSADSLDKIRKTVEEEAIWRQLTDVALGRYFLLLAWAALYLALENAAQVQAAERREGEFKRAAKAAELRSLRYQVNPHFLFNTLNSLSSLVMSGRTEEAERMIQTMSSFYRNSLAGDPTADVPLADEIALQRHYLEIEGVRFPERLRVQFDIPPELGSACVPGMILQPLVENSVKYAVSATARPVTIRIVARQEAGQLVLTVSDDGPGKPTGASGTGIGLANVRDRLAARFGKAATVDSGPLRREEGPAGENELAGYSTRLTIPVIRNEC